MRSNLAERLDYSPHGLEETDPPTAAPAATLSDDELDILSFRIDEFRARDELQRCFVAGALAGVPLLAEP